MLLGAIPAGTFASCKLNLASQVSGERPDKYSTCSSRFGAGRRANDPSQ